jgi:hypothetical protein
MVIHIKRHHFFDAFDTYDGKFTFGALLDLLDLFNLDLLGLAQSKSVLDCPLLLVVMLGF